MPIFSKVKRHEGKVGGVFYFLSVFSLLIVCVFTCVFFIFQISGSTLQRVGSPIYHFCFLSLGMLLGFCLSGKISVFIHELKHSIVSSFAGNSARGMKIEEDSGHFEYAFSKSTAHLNAFISLAPYTFPLFTLVAFIPYFLIQSSEPFAAKALLSCSLGIDLFQNFKDASPYQTDFSEVRGGYKIGMLYVMSFNLIIFCLIYLFVVFNQAVFSEMAQWIFNFAMSMAGI